LAKNGFEKQVVQQTNLDKMFFQQLTQNGLFEKQVVQQTNLDNPDEFDLDNPILLHKFI